MFTKVSVKTCPFENKKPKAENKRIMSGFYVITNVSTLYAHHNNFPYQIHIAYPTDFFRLASRCLAFRR